MAGWLVVNADDLGVSKGATLGIVRAHREGIVTSASLAVTTPFYEHALETCVRRCPDLGVGLHFTLTSGTPVSDPTCVPLLVGPDGRFRWRFTSLLVAAGFRRQADLLDQISVELEAQLQRLKRDGVRPDHIDGERHVHLIPEIFERVADAARRHGVRYIRAGRDLLARSVSVRDTPALLASGGPVKSWLLSQLGARGRATLNDGLTSAEFVASYLYTGRADAIAHALRARPSAGVSEVMVHPGLPEENGPLDLGNRELERYLMLSDRRAELGACIAARVQPHGWRLTNYRELSRQATRRSSSLSQ